MSKKSKTDSDLLNRALKIAATEAFFSEMLETEVDIDNPKKINPNPTSRRLWIKERMDKWLDEAELVI